MNQRFGPPLHSPVRQVPAGLRVARLATVRPASSSLASFARLPPPLFFCRLWIGILSLSRVCPWSVAGVVSLGHVPAAELTTVAITIILHYAAIRPPHPPPPPPPGPRQSLAIKGPVRHLTSGPATRHSSLWQPFCFFSSFCFSQSIDSLLHCFCPLQLGSFRPLQLGSFRPSAASALAVPLRSGHCRPPLASVERAYLLILSFHRCAS